MKAHHLLSLACLAVALCLAPTAWAAGDAGVKKQHAAPSSLKFNLDLSLGSWVTDRAYQTSTDAFDATFDGLVNLSLRGTGWGVYYKGGWSAFFVDNSLTHHAHQLTAEKRFSLPFLDGSLALGGVFSWDDYAEYFTTYDRIRPELYLGLKLYTSSNSSLRLLSSVGYAHYLTASEYSHLYHSLSLQATAWFSTKTTVRLQADWTYKAYLDGSNASNTSINPDITSSNRLQAYLRIAQSLSRQAALRLWGAWIPKVNQEYRFNDTRSTTLSQNLSDDLNAVDGWAAGVELELRPASIRGLRLTVLGNWRLSHFGGHAARDASGNAVGTNIEREDQIWSLGATLAYRLPFDISGFWGSGVYLKASYLFRINTSNDASFTYNQHLGYAGLSTRW